MSKVYVKRYSNNGAPKSLAPVTVGAGNLRSLDIAFPPEGYITRLVVKQTGGTNVAFVLELLESGIPYPAGQVAVATAPADDIELYRIMPQQAGLSGVAFELEGNQPGFPYRNDDGTFTLPQRFIYLIIKPTGSVGTTTWDIAITAHTDIGY